MSHRPKTKLVSLAAAIAALVGAGVPIEPLRAAVAADTPSHDRANQTEKRPNRFVEAGDDLFGFIVTERADGTVEARHSSHYSHRSHSSHRSHYSSRY